MAVDEQRSGGSAKALEHALGVPRRPPRIPLLLAHEPHALTLVAAVAGVIVVVG